jgi:hypothetical protein
VVLAEPDELVSELLSSDDPLQVILVDGRV